MAKTKKVKQEVKPQEVNIKKVAPVVIAGQTGPLTFMWGLGDDNRMYLWESQTHKWILG